MARDDLDLVSRDLNWDLDLEERDENFDIEVRDEDEELEVRDGDVDLEARDDVEVYTRASSRYGGHRRHRPRDLEVRRGGSGSAGGSGHHH